MVEFTRYTVQNAPASSRPFLQDVSDAYGFTPNLLAVLAESPAAIESYVALASTISEKSSFNSIEEQVVLLAAARENRCEYCIAGHSTKAAKVSVTDDVVESLRSASPIADPKLDALAKFTRALVQQSGWLEDEATDEFLAAGYGTQHILEVILCVALKTISNYTNHLAHTELDAAIAPQAWTPPHTAAV